MSSSTGSTCFGAGVHKPQLCGADLSETPICKIGSDKMLHSLFSSIDEFRQERGVRDFGSCDTQGVPDLVEVSQSLIEKPRG